MGGCMRRLRWSAGVNRAMEQPWDAVSRRVDALEQRLLRLEEAVQATPVSVLDKKQSLAEILRRIGASSHVENVHGAAFYLEAVRGEAVYNKDDLVGEIRSAKYRVPGNPNEAINGLVRQGWLMEVPAGKGGMKAWTLTQDGLREVQRKMDGGL
jgi:hypothetical protein